MVKRDIETTLLPIAAERGISTLSYSSLALGLLSGRMGPERTFSGDDQRKGQSPLLARQPGEGGSPHGGDRARGRRRTGPRKAQVVIAWTLQQPGITFALCGARNPDQARENARAGRIRLSTDEVDAIERCRDDPSDESRRLRRTRWSTRTEHRLGGRV